MMGNRAFWAGHIEKVFLPEIEFFSHCLTNRIIPSLTLSDEESRRIEDEICDRANSSIDSEDADPADVVERAHDECMTFHGMMNDIRQGTVNLFCVGLRHLFEQQLLLLHRKELLKIEEENDAKLLKLGEVEKQLEASGIKISEYSSWRKIEELRLVCNTVKHADGRSASQLRERKPSLFSPSNAIFADPIDPPAPVYHPLFGQDLYVNQVDFLAYVCVVKEFWNSLREELMQQHPGQ